MSEIKVKITKNGNRRFLTMYYDDPLTGKREQRSTKQTSRTKALKAAGKWEDELNSGRYCPNSRITWEAFRDLYEKQKLAGMSRKTHSAFSTAANHLEEIIAPKHLASITPMVLSRFQAELRDKRRVVKSDEPDKPDIVLLPMSLASVAAHLRHLKAALGWAVEKRLLPKVPDIDMPKKAKGQAMMRGRPITAEEFDRMIAILPKVRKHDTEVWKRYLNGLWLSGLRLEESTIVSWDQDAPFCIDLSGKFPRFRIYAEAHKGNRDVFLPMTPDFAAFILQTPEADRHGRVFSLLSLDTGKPMSAGRVGKILSRIGRKAGVVVDKSKDQYATAHDLRRSFGTRWSKKVAPAILRNLMRHSSITTTMAYYVELEADDIAAGLWKDQGEVVRTFVRTTPSEAVSDQTDTTASESQVHLPSNVPSVG